MVKKSQEFFFYFKNKPKRYVQYIKLLFEGGRMVLIDILHQELEKQALSLTDVLLGSRESLLAKDEAALSEIYMQSSSSETRINTDTSTWDIQSLAMVISYICNTNENQVIVNEVDIISNARKDYAEAAFLSLNIEKFSICREDLVSSIKTLSSLAGAETYKKCNALLEKYRKEMDTDLNNNDNPYLDQLTTHGMNVKTLSEVYTEVLGKLNIALNKMAADNHVFQQDQVLELKMVTLGRTKEKTEIAENILTTVWEAAIKMSDTPNDFVEVRKKVDVILEHIRAIPDVDTIKVENHCILLSMSCRSCYGLTQLLEYMESDSLKRHLASVSLEIGFVCNDTFCITGNITFESLYQLTTVIVFGTTEIEANLNSDKEVTPLENLQTSSNDVQKEGSFIVADEEQTREQPKASMLKTNECTTDSTWFKDSEKETEDNRSNGEDKSIYCRTIKVSGSRDVINVNTMRFLKMYFKNKGRSDGETVNVTEYKCLEPGVATFTFETRNDAERIAERDDYVFRSEPLEVAMLPVGKKIDTTSFEDKKDDEDTEVKKIKITGLTSSLAAQLAGHLEKLFSDVHVISVKHDEGNSSAVVEFDDSKGIANILRKGELSIEGQMVGVALYEDEPFQSSTVVVKGRSDIDSQLDSLKIYFQNTALSGGGNITKCYTDRSNNVAYITFETEDVAQRVVDKYHNAEGLEVALFQESELLNKDDSGRETKGEAATAVLTNQLFTSV